MIIVKTFFMLWTDIMKNLKLSIFTAISLLSVSAFAMDEPDFTPLPQTTIHIPEKFPGHDSRPIVGTVKVTNVFNPEDYQQDKTRNEGVCSFNSMLAGIMWTDYGRRKVQDLIKLQDDTNVYIRFYFPSSDVLTKYDRSLEDMKEVQDYSDRLIKAPVPNNDAITSQLKKLNTISLFWGKAIHASETVVQVPKNFVTRSDLVGGKGSFPHQSPEWLNLIQQAYMGLTKNNYIRGGASSGGYFRFGIFNEEIQEQDVFWGIPLCSFEYALHESVRFPKRDRAPFNVIQDKSSLQLFPLVDISFRAFAVPVNEEEGVNFNDFYDVKENGFENGTQIFEVHPYNSIADFSYTHGLSKDLLMASNVVRFGTCGHSVALFFGKGTVHYYDNVWYPPQTAVYGKEGPIFEEAFHFKDKNINTMGEEEFLTCLFKEIAYRLKQVSKIREQEFHPKTTLFFFEKPLI